MTSTMPRDFEEELRDMNNRTGGSEDGHKSSQGTSPSDMDTTVPSGSQQITWTGTKNTAATPQVSISSLCPKNRKQTIEKWLKPITDPSVQTGMHGKKRNRSPSPVQRSGHKSICLRQSPGGDTVPSTTHALTSTPIKNCRPSMSHDDASTLVPEGAWTFPSFINITVDSPTKMAEEENTIMNLLALEQSSPLKEDYCEIANFQLHASQELNSTISCMNLLKKYMSENENERESSKNTALDAETFSFYETNNRNNIENVSLSVPQVTRTLPREAETSWIPAKDAVKEAIRFTHRSNFLQGAIDNGITEEWAVQLERMPTFLTKIPEFKKDFYQMRLKHARETMELAVKHLNSSIIADKRTAKTMKSAAFLLTEQTLGETEAKAAIEQAKKEWNTLVDKTNHFEVKQLKERKIKMERKVLQTQDVMDPVNKILPLPENDKPSTSETDRQDFGRRGRGRFRGRGRRGNNSRPYTKSRPRDSK